MVALAVVISHARSLVLDISSYVMIEPFRLLVPWPKEVNRLLAPIRPFQPPVSASAVIQLHPNRYIHFLSSSARQFIFNIYEASNFLFHLKIQF